MEVAVLAGAGGAQAAMQELQQLDVPVEAGESVSVGDLASAVPAVSLPEILGGMSVLMPAS